MEKLEGSATGNGRRRTGMGSRIGSREKLIKVGNVAGSEVGKF